MKTISVKDLEAKLKSVEKDDLFVDVRSVEEFEQEHIVGFENKPLETLENWTNDCKGKTVYLTCFSGNRAQDAEKEIEAKCPGAILFLCEGGMLAWKEAGLSTRKKEAPKEKMEAPKAKKNEFVDVVKTELIHAKTSFIELSVERQESVVIGTLLLLSLFFGDLSMFFALIIGILYLFSGMTGKRVLKNLLKKMPWNKKTN